MRSLRWRAAVRCALRCFTVLIVGSAPGARADWINLTGAENTPTVIEVHVEADGVDVRFEIYPDDAFAFAELLVDGRSPTAAADIAQPFQIAADGALLTGETRLVERRPRTVRPTPFASAGDPRWPAYTRPPADPTVIYVERRYAFARQPDALVLSPPLKDNGYPALNIGFIVFHQSVPVIDFRYLSSPELLRLDWDDPWYSRFDNPNLSRHHRFPLMSFLYVEAHEVRHEILVRVQDAARWLNIDLEQVRDNDQLLRRIGEFMLTRNPLRIDGQAVRPILDRVNFVTADVNGVQVVSTAQPPDPVSAIVGIIIAYVPERMPESVTIRWQLFDGRDEQVPVTLTDPAGSFQVFVTPQDPVIRWQNLLRDYRAPTVAAVPVQAAAVRLPVVSIALLLVAVLVAVRAPARRWRAGGLGVGVLAAAACVGIGRMTVPVPWHTALASPAEPETVTLAILGNIYRAFDFRRDEDAYDKLALSVSGDLLSELFLQHRRSFLIANQGGARARVQDVELLQLSPEPGRQPGAYRCRWVAAGSVGHWGHVHWRRNQYEALLTLAAVNGSWRLTGLEFVDEQRLSGAAGSGAEVAVDDTN